MRVTLSVSRLTEAGRFCLQVGHCFAPYKSRWPVEQKLKLL